MSVVRDDVVRQASAAGGVAPPDREALVAGALGLVELGEELFKSFTGRGFADVSGWCRRFGCGERRNGGGGVLSPRLGALERPGLKEDGPSRAAVVKEEVRAAMKRVTVEEIAAERAVVEQARAGVNVEGEDAKLTHDGRSVENFSRPGAHAPGPRERDT